MATYNKLIILSDGAARGNPGPAGAGGVIKTPRGAVLAEISEYLGETTNNIAEYKALILALERTLAFNPKEIEVRADSELVVKQLNGEYRVKNEGLKPLYEQARRLLAGFNKVTVRHIYRSENKRADELANRAIDAAGYTSATEYGSTPATSKTNELFPDNSSEQGTLF